MASYLYEAENAVNLDGGSSSIMYLCNQKIQPIFTSSFPYKSQNYVIFYTNLDYKVYSEKTFYYYFPGIFGFGKKINDSLFGSKYVTFFNGYQKYQKIIFNNNFSYFLDPGSNLLFLQTNDIELSLEKLKNIFEKVEILITYYNCYILRIGRDI